MGPEVARMTRYPVIGATYRRRRLLKCPKVQEVPRRRGSFASAGSRQDAAEDPDHRCEPPEEEGLLAAKAAAAADDGIIEDFTVMNRRTCLHPQLGAIAIGRTASACAGTRPWGARGGGSSTATARGT